MCPFSSQQYTIILWRLLQHITLLSSSPLQTTLPQKPNYKSTPTISITIHNFSSAMNPTAQAEQQTTTTSTFPRPSNKRPSSSFMASTSHVDGNSASIANMEYDHLFSILHLLPVDSIISFSMTCKKFRSLASQEILWEFVCRRDWGSGLVNGLLSSLSTQERSDLSWKRLYRLVSRLSSLSCQKLLTKDGRFPRSRASHSLNFVSNCLVLFGGGCEGGRHLDDTWVAYMGSGPKALVNWQQVFSGTPSGRFGHSCTVVGDAIILFGGIDDSGIRHNDTWVGNLAFEEKSVQLKISWRLLDVGLLTPSARGAHAASSAGDRRIVIHGGIGLYGLRLNDMWILELSDGLNFGKWHQITTISRLSPLPRSGHSLTWCSEDVMVLFGGRGSGYEVLNDVWILDIRRENPQWLELKYEYSSTSQSERPLPRVGHSATPILGGYVLIYGGEDSHRHRKDDFWILDISTLLKIQHASSRSTLSTTLIWKKLMVEGHNPENRSFHAACVDRSGRYIYVFGGMVDGLVQPAEAYGLRFDGDLYVAELMLPQ